MCVCVCAKFLVSSLHCWQHIWTHTQSQGTIYTLGKLVYPLQWNHACVSVKGNPLVKSMEHKFYIVVKDWKEITLCTVNVVNIRQCIVNYYHKRPTKWWNHQFSIKWRTLTHYICRLWQICETFPQIPKLWVLGRWLYIWQMDCISQKGVMGPVTVEQWLALFTYRRKVVEWTVGVKMSVNSLYVTCSSLLYPQGANKQKCILSHIGDSNPEASLTQIFIPRCHPQTKSFWLVRSSGAQPDVKPIQPHSVML